VRSATKTFVGLAGIGVLVATAKLGMPAAVAANTVSNVAAETPAATSTPTPTPTPTKAATTGTKTRTPAKTTSSGSTKTTTPTTTPTPTVSGATQTGSAIRYRYGVVQVKVTKKSGNITSITYLQKSATAGRGSVFPNLVAAAKAANGSNISNISGATYTTEAFKQALDSALAKF
jgi:uncharacterized protein with FMN-binding domain